MYDKLWKAYNYFTPYIFLGLSLGLIGHNLNMSVFLLLFGIGLGFGFIIAYFQIKFYEKTTTKGE